jgi:hypothetical protein
MSRILTLLLSLMLSAGALAAEGDPPSRVARLSLIAGAVSFQPSGDGAPQTAELNQPLTWGDRLLTESNSRTEMSMGTAAVRLDGSTDLTIANLDADIAQLELNSGTLGIHVRELRDDETFEVDTLNAAIVLGEPGDYRIAVDAQGATVLAVLSGAAQLDGGSGAIRVAQGEELRFTGGEQLADVLELGSPTAFDEWCLERERTLAARESTRYLSREVVGYEDLDRHGYWWNEPGYGYVWSPTYISIGWAPYRFGHWAWISPWGYTWVDHAPWGYAPFHYGRWAHVRDRWCWVPGPRHVRPVWAPALVGWHGMRGVRDPSRPGSVTWFPLGPRDVYVPTYRATPRYVRAVNISNTTIANNTQITNAWRGRLRDPGHANRDVPGAMSSLPAASFARDVVRSGGVRPMNPAPGAASPPHLSTLHSGPASDNAWREAFNTPRAEVAHDPRRSVPRVPSDRRALQATPNSATSPVDPATFRRPVQPPPRHLNEVQRATPSNAWRSDLSRKDRGGHVVRSGGRAERAASGGVESRGSGPRPQSTRGGESRMSGSNSQSSRAGAQSSGRSGGEARMSSGSRNGRGGGLSARP